MACIHTDGGFRVDVPLGDDAVHAVGLRTGGKVAPSCRGGSHSSRDGGGRRVGGGQRADGGRGGEAGAQLEAGGDILHHVAGEEGGLQELAHVFGGGLDLSVLRGEG